MSPEDTHKAIRIYIGGLILGVNTLYMLFCFFKLLAVVGNELSGMSQSRPGPSDALHELIFLSAVQRQGMASRRHLRSWCTKCCRPLLCTCPVNPRTVCVLEAVVGRRTAGVGAPAPSHDPPNVMSYCYTCQEIIFNKIEGIIRRPIKWRSIMIVQINFKSVECFTCMTEENFGYKN